MRTLLLTITCCVATVSHADTCQTLFSETTPEALMIMKVIRHVGFEHVICSVEELSCRSVCACALQTFTLLENASTASDETKQRLRQSFFDQHHEELSCAKEMM